MDRSEAFLDLYRDLEETLGAKYGQKLGTVQLFSQREGARFAEELNLFREMRNLLSHHSKIGDEAAVQPSQSAVEKLREILLYAKNPPAAMSVATPVESLCCAKKNDSVEDTVAIMEERGYSHIPVLSKKGVLTGVFSVGTLFASARANPQRPVRGLILSDVSDHLPPDAHTTEKFIFESPAATLFALKEHFTLTGPCHRRVAAIFITEDGTRYTPLLGMVTPWDVIKNEK